MFDDITRGYIDFARHNLALCLWRMLRLVNADADAERREFCRNLVCSMPEPHRRDFAAEIDWVVRNGLSQSMTFPYDEQAERALAEVHDDASLKLRYVNHRGRKLYFPRSWGTETVSKAYSVMINDEGITGKGIRMKSPHAYVDKDFEVASDDVLLDVGCAEALFALDKIETVRKAYLFEGLKQWQKPLMATFAPYSSKATLSFGYVGDGTGGATRLHDIVKEPSGTTYFIKMDIEGAEREVLRASADFLKSNKVKLSCCVYHRQDDAEVIEMMLKEIGFACSFSDGWMLPDFNGFKFPYFRHGVIRARNY